MNFDGNRLVLEQIGDSDRLVDFLRRYGVQRVPGHHAIDKWRSRGMPGEWVLLVLVLLEVELGQPVSLRPYVKQGAA